MDEISTYQHHPAIEELAEHLSVHTERDQKSFFRVIIAYYLGIMASCMRARVSSTIYGDIPLNTYAIALAHSGFGKGKSTSEMEQRIMCDFRTTFRDFVLSANAEKNLDKLASRFAALKGTAEESERLKLQKEFEACGEYPFVFDGGSEAAIKQVRHMLLMADCGSLNLQIDEIGTNLQKVGTTEAMAAYLELYDLGMIKAKLKMNTADSKRAKELEGYTPANMLLFGTQTKLLDGGKIEREFTSMLETGYARRCLFAMVEPETSVPVTQEELEETIDKVYARAANPKNKAVVNKWRQHFAALADPLALNWTISVPEASDKLIERYKRYCKARTLKISEYDEIRRAEMEHRYFRVIKVAGILAFTDASLHLDISHVKSAIKLVEESGENFATLMAREPAHAKLARFIASLEREVTHAELFDALPFFKSAAKSQRQELLDLAISWGYKNHIVLKKWWHDGIEMHSGEALKKTSLDALSLSYSGDFAYGYDAGTLPLARFPDLTQEADLHWSAHSFLDGHRCEDKCIPGFNIAVFDVDGTATLDMVHELLKDHPFMTYTTKRHTPDVHRFRLILPMNYTLKLDADDYRQFMRNVMSWLPFPVDESAIDRSRKWMTNDSGTYHINMEGELFDVLPFVPKTFRAEEREKELKSLGSLDNLERWFAQRIASGNRNNQMFKYAVALVDSGMPYNEVEQRVLAFNGKLSNPLSRDELLRTVLVSVDKHIAKRNQSAA